MRPFSTDIQSPVRHIDDPLQNRNVKTGKRHWIGIGSALKKQDAVPWAGCGGREIHERGAIEGKSVIEVKGDTRACEGSCPCKIHRPIKDVKTRVKCNICTPTYGEPVITPVVRCTVPLKSSFAPQPAVDGSVK